MAATLPSTVQDRALPNAALRLLLISIQDVMGPDGMKAVLTAAKMPLYIDNYPPNNLEYGATYAQYGLLEQAIEEFYGPRGARAMLLRVGRATFQTALKEQSAVLGLARQALKNVPLLSMQSKIKLLLQQMVAAANKTLNQPARLEENAEAFIVVVDKCMCEYRPPHSQPCCHIKLGTFTEGIRWLTDRQLDIQEITCLNNGADACRYRIPKRMSAE